MCCFHLTSLVCCALPVTPTLLWLSTWHDFLRATDHGATEVYKNPSSQLMKTKVSSSSDCRHILKNADTWSLSPSGFYSAAGGPEQHSSVSQCLLCRCRLQQQLGKRGQESSLVPTTPQHRGTCKIIFINLETGLKNYQVIFIASTCTINTWYVWQGLIFFKVLHFMVSFSAGAKLKSLLESSFNEHSPPSKWNTIDRQDAEGNKRWLETRVSFLYIDYFILSWLQQSWH